MSSLVYVPVTNLPSHLIVKLAFFHILIIAFSNYLVQFPLPILKWHTTWGALSFPFIFLASDLTVRILGAQMARRVILWSMVPALFFSYILSLGFDQGIWKEHVDFLKINTLVARIAFASFMAYLFGQWLDIAVFNRLRQQFSWWVAPAVSAIFGNAVDTWIFFSCAFWQSPDAFMAEHWPEIAVIDYFFKIVINLLLFLPLYRQILNLCLKKWAIK